MTHSIIDLIQRHAQNQPEKIAYRYHDAKSSLDRITFRALSERTRMAAAVLRRRIGAGERVAILLPNSIEYILAVFAAQAAGLIPVPLMEPSRGIGARSRRLEEVLRDCQASAVIVDDTQFEDGPLICISTDVLLAPTEPLEWNDIVPADIAFLQYTSGSTSIPKGVMVSHANLISNSLQLSAGLGTHSQTVFGSWLPLFHDMGLVGKIMHPLHLGASSHLIRPETFMRRPRRWLEMVSECAVNISAAPNFAYERCCDVITQVDGLDLSSWILALNGSEPVRAQTLDRFSRMFATCGFQYEYFRPVYGMAEATLFVTSRGTGQPIRTAPSEAHDPARDFKARPLVSVGRPWCDAAVVVWNANENREAVEGETGEILISGSNCSNGYFGRPELSSATFCNLFPGFDRPYMRSEDLGFTLKGELYITGRKKEIILIRGRNVYPQDIESAVQSVDVRLVRDGGAAVQVECAHGSLVVLVQEVQSTQPEATLAELLASITAAVLEETGVKLDAIVPIRRGQLLKTTSGKIARAQVRAMLAEGAFPGFSVASIDASVRCSELLAWWHKMAPRWDGRLADERRSIAPHVILQMGNRGLLGMNQPLQNGGAEIGVVGMMRLIREASATDLTLAAFLGVHNGLVVEPIARFGTATQQSRWLPDLASGRRLGCFAITERSGGSNPRAITARAVRRSGTWHLDGRKIWIGSAAWSDVAVFFANAYEDDGSALGMTAFLVPTDTPGVQLGVETLTLGMRGMVQSDLDLVDVRLDASHVLGAPGQGFDIAQQTMALGRLGVANMALGSMQRCLKTWEAYARNRRIATGTLLDHPVTLSRLFKAHAEAAAIAWWCEQCAAKLGRHDAPPVEILSLLKVASTEASWNTVDQLMQALGGRGYDESNRVAQLMRDNRLLRIFEGSSEVLQAHAGHALASGQESTSRFLAEHVPAELLSAFAEQVSLVLDSCRAAAVAPTSVHVAVGRAAGVWLLQCGLHRVDSTVLEPQDLQFASQSLQSQWFATLQEARLEVGWLHRGLASIERMSAPLALLPWRPQSMNISTAPSLVAESTITAPRVPIAALSHPSTAGAAYSGANIAAWIAQWIASRSPTATAVHYDRSFTELGLDSVDAVDLVDELITRYGFVLEPGMLWEFPTITRLSERLVGSVRTSEPESAHAALQPLPLWEHDDIALVLAKELD